MKRLIVCLDGTWMRADRGAHSTNVVKLMRAIAPVDGGGNPQVLHYAKGVGAEGGRLVRAFAGATGAGLEENVKDAYLFLGNNLEPDEGDEIYLFGFSRGAYTARSLAGLIGAAGLLDRSSMSRLNQAWDFYRTPPAKRRGKDHPGGRPVQVACVGVWDTVGARGVPLRWFAPSDWLRRHKYGFHDVQLGTSVRCALHAVAVDEQRGQFAPTLWERRADLEPDPAQVVEQVWFAGCHSDVGGGVEPKDATPAQSLEHSGLPDLALEWMVERLTFHTDLAFRDDWRDQKREVRPDPLGRLHESRSALYFTSRILPFERVIGGHRGWTRRILPSRNEPEPGCVFMNETLHPSVVERFGKVPKGARDPYTPKNVAAAREGGVRVAPGPPGEKDTPGPRARKVMARSR